ncbi:hypothetical protein [Liquorilactobacillus satsumensis]|nr:hypothetical protein [Liquorilactobacillus satsumensis]
MLFIWYHFNVVFVHAATATAREQLLKWLPKLIWGPLKHGESK